MRVLKWSVVIGVAVLLCARDAAAQEPSAAQPLVIERIRAGFIVAPDFKVTMLDDQVGELAGGYAARVLDNTLIVGGAAYWLVNDARDFRTTYGGLLLGWSPPRTGRIRFGGRAVVGVGTATLGSDLSGAVGFRRVQAAPVRFGGRIDPRTDPRMGPASRARTISPAAIRAVSLTLPRIPPAVFAGSLPAETNRVPQQTSNGSASDGERQKARGEVRIHHEQQPGGQVRHALLLFSVRE